MWKRIHSNRDPRDTLYKEVRKEFGTYFDEAGVFFRTQFTTRPRFYFGLMVSVLSLSILIVSALSWHKHSVVASITPHSRTSVASAVTDGFSQIVQATSEIRETIRLKQLVDSISSKKQLSRSDSTALDNALTRLQKTQTHLPNK